MNIVKTVFRLVINDKKSDIIIVTDEKSIHNIISDIDKSVIDSPGYDLYDLVHMMIGKKIKKIEIVNSKVEMNDTVIQDSVWKK